MRTEDEIILKDRFIPGYCQRQVIYLQARGRTSTTKKAPDNIRIALI